MSTLRLQMTRLQSKKYGLFFFPLDNSLEPVKTSQVNDDGSLVEGNMVRLYWDKKNPDLPAKVVFLEDSLDELEKKRCEMMEVGVEISLTATDKEFIANWTRKQEHSTRKRKSIATDSTSNKQKVAKQTVVHHEMGNENKNCNEIVDVLSVKTDCETRRNSASDTPTNSTLTINLSPTSTVHSSVNLVNQFSSVNPTINELTLLKPAASSTLISNSLTLNTIPSRADVPVTVPLEPSPYISNANSSTSLFSSNLLPGAANISESNFNFSSMCAPLSPIPSITQQLNSTFSSQTNTNMINFENTFTTPNTSFTTASDVHINTTGQTNVFDDSYNSQTIREIAEKVDQILGNQQLIIQALRNFGLSVNGQHIERTATTCTTRVSEQNQPSGSLGSTPPPSFATHSKYFTLDELQALNRQKRKNTTDGYFAVMLLRKLTTASERANCTVYGEGKKSKGLNPNVLSQIKTYYTSLYKEETWNDAVTAMNSHLRKYCVIKQE